MIDDIILAPICSGGGFTFDPSLIFQLILSPSGTVYEWIVSDQSLGTSQGGIVSYLLMRCSCFIGTNQS